MDDAPLLLKFKPILKRLIWGGRRLGDLLNKPVGAESDYAESWEIVDHGADQSVVIDGPLASKTLAQLMSECPQWLIGDSFTESSFPVLLKYLDCERVLSVQVHPDDSYALRMPKPDRGKTEAWYIIDAAPGSLVYSGLKSGVDQPQFEAAVRAGATEEVLHSFPPTPGDCLFIPAGTVHALGGGLLVAEIQQSSDTTFRIFDWNRVDDQGKSRQLHVRESLEVIRFDTGPVEPIRRERGRAGFCELVHCDKFSLASLDVGQAKLGGDGICRLVTVPTGSARVVAGETFCRLEAGDSILVPAGTGEVTCEVDPGGCLLAMRPTPTDRTS